MIESTIITKVVNVSKMLHTNNQCIHVIENKIVQTIFVDNFAVHHYRFYRKAYVDIII